MLNHERLPLEWLIQQPAYLKPLWDELSTPQKTLIKAAYGLQLDGDGEKKAWAVLNGACVTDELGYVVKWDEIPYDPQEFKTIVALIGRRAGKSHLMCFMLLYEVLFGGHLAHVNPGQDVIVPYIAQDLATAKSNMRYVSLLARLNPKLYKQIESDTRDKIQFKNGITIQPEPPSIKTGRGVAIPVVIMDEVAFWYKQAENANPDYEVLRAVNNAQVQFPFSKRFIISTPYTEEGLLWEYWRAGTNGVKAAKENQGKYQGALVVQASLAALENPKVHSLGRGQIQQIFNDDPDIFPRESLAQFIASESNFIPGVIVDQCTDKDVKFRRRKDVEKDGLLPNYVAVMDPAFRHDDFAFSIFHMDGRGLVIQDYLQVWTPNKKLNIRLEPQIIINQIASLVREWAIPVVYSDQYQLESLQQLAQAQSFTIIGHDFTGTTKSKIYGSLETLLKTKRIRFLDIPEIRQQLSQLNKKNTALGNVQIGAPPSKKDDIATVCALGAHISLTHYPSVTLKKPEETLFEQLVRQHQQKNKGARWDS